MKTAGSRLSRVCQFRFWMPVAALLMSGAMLAAPAAAQGTRAKADPHMLAENRVWIDEHSRWQSEHLAAARRLETVVAALKGLDTTLDDHGAQVRAHVAALAEGKNADAQIAAHALLRAAHEEERIAHHDLMNAIELIELEMAKEQARERTDRVRDRR
jgi:hypothetical protein